MNNISFINIGLRNCGEKKVKTLDTFLAIEIFSGYKVTKFLDALVTEASKIEYLIFDSATGKFVYAAF
ncbi:hypothetical protein EHO58_05430 [Leptospira selangorensis]|uniref:hypothetical protein n=1 Tax=Leptospira selangorensis TaxID=2484982 RepID=UPI00108435CC|nr:hypothetical protein [Leptospira selangorensis]TGK09811.1 hypothetical protein EHO58_05430 [Leptospira selangorensis]